MKHLLRTRVDRFAVEESLRLSEIEERMREGSLGEVLLPVDEVFSSYPRLQMRTEADRLVHNGNPFSGQDVQEIFDGERVRVYDSTGKFVGIYGRHEEKGGLLYRPVKMFLS